MKSHTASVWLSFSWMAHSERSQSPCFENTHTALWRGLCEEQISVCVCVHSHALSLSVVSDSATPWTVAQQAPLFMGSSRQEYWIGLPFPPPGALPHPGIECMSPTLAGGFFTTEPPGKLPLLIASTKLVAI